MNWIHLAQYRDSYGDFVNTAMNRYVLYNAKMLFSSWAADGF
jgi:hypothetical protein